MEGFLEEVKSEWRGNVMKLRGIAERVAFEKAGRREPSL